MAISSFYFDLQNEAHVVARSLAAGHIRVDRAIARQLRIFVSDCIEPMRDPREYRERQLAALDLYEKLLDDETLLSARGPRKGELSLLKVLIALCACADRDGEVLVVCDR